MESEFTGVNGTERKDSLVVGAKGSRSKSFRNSIPSIDGCRTVEGKYSPSFNVDPNVSRRNRVLKFVSTLTVEPYIFLYMFSFMLHAIAQKTLTMEKACRHELKFSEEICYNITATKDPKLYKDVKGQVESIANDFSAYGDFIRFIPGTLIVIYTGAWSDKYGRKPPIIFALIGVLLEDVILLLNAVFYEAPISYFLFASIPGGLTGGFMCVISTAFSLATEQVPKNLRNLRFAFLQLGMYFGMSFGILTGGFLSRLYSYTVLFMISAVGHAVAMLWVVLFVTETRKAPSNVTWSQKLRDFFRVQHAVDGFKACLKKRPNKGRIQVLMILASICCLMATHTCLADIAFVYTYDRYSWDNENYAIISTTFDVTGVLVTLLCVPLFTKVFKMGDPLLGLIGTVSMFVKNICVAFADQLWLYYLGYSIGVFSGFAPLAFRSRLSKLSQNDELGKIFAFMAACESLVPSVASIAITKLYNATIESSVPGAAYLPPSALLLIPIGFLIWLIMRRSVQYKKMEENAEEDETTENKKIGKWQSTHPRF